MHPPPYTQIGAVEKDDVLAETINITMYKEEDACACVCVSETMSC
jgi:hypothetical protein